MVPHVEIKNTKRGPALARSTMSSDLDMLSGHALRRPRGRMSPGGSCPSRSAARMRCLHGRLKFERYWHRDENK